MATSSRSQLLEILVGYGAAQALHVAASLDLADHLAAGPKTAAELAQITGANPTNLERLLSALANLGIVAAEGDTFALDEVGECLRGDVAGSVKPIIRYLASPTCWDPWGQLRYSVMTGKTAFDHLYGTDAWSYRAAHPEVNTLFNAATRALSTGRRDTIASHYDFSRFGTVVDVGGGNGALIAEILARNPTVRGVLFDQPHVVSGSADVLREKGVADRCEVVAGSFFEAVPRDGDLYLLRAVIHDWDDEAATAILRTCRRAMGPGSRLMLVERVRHDAGARDGFFSHYLDLHMMVTLGGRQRSSEEFAALYAASGFELASVVRLPGGASMVECLLEGAPVG